MDQNWIQNATVFTPCICWLRWNAKIFIFHKRYHIKTQFEKMGNFNIMQLVNRDVFAICVFLMGWVVFDHLVAVWIKHKAHIEAEQKFGNYTIHCILHVC